MSEKTNGKPNLTFGVRVPNSGPLATVESMVEVAQEAESLGFDSVWVHDHLTWSEEIHRTHISSGADHSHQGNDSPDFYEAMTSLSYLAGLVRSVRLGIACVVVPCRNPLLAAKQIATLPALSVEGLMTIGRYVSPQESREEQAQDFRRLVSLQDLLQAELSLSLPTLSMGMSHDFEIAIEEGATVVRVGTAVFGSR